MAKKPTRGRRKGSGRKTRSGSSETVTIQQPANAATVTVPFAVSGSGSPDGASVTGYLTDGNNPPNTFQSNPATATIQLGSWILTFQNVPSGAYTLAVQELDPSSGADAIGLTVAATVPAVNITAVKPPASGASGTFTVSGTVTNLGSIDPTTLLLSAVISSPKPTHVVPARFSPKSDGTFSVDFTKLNLASGPAGTVTQHTATVYPARDRGKGGKFAFPVTT